MRGGRGPLALTVAAVVLTTSAPAHANDATSAAETASADAATADDPLPEVNRYLKEAATKTGQGHHVAAADLYIAAYDLLDDPRRFRNERSSVMSMIYGALIAAYERAESDTAKLSRGCRLRGLLVAFLDDLERSYGDASGSFPEVVNARDKLQSLDLMLAAHGEPEAVCATYDAAAEPRRAIPMLDPAKPSRSFGQPSGPGASAGSQSFIDPTDDNPERRSGARVTAVGGVLIGVGAIGLGVMTPFLVRGAQMIGEIERINEVVESRGPDADRTAEEQTEAEYYDAKGREANIVAYSTGIAGGAALVTGVVLVVLGRKKMRSAKMSVTPQLSPTTAGLSLHMRF
jgi:VIT1/CCC1 family predicted Fe2+/Mn2+ transporter